VLKCAVEHVGERAQKRIRYRYSELKCAIGPVQGWAAEAADGAADEAIDRGRKGGGRVWGYSGNWAGFKGIIRRAHETQVR
jgi:hypothetical protein